MENTNRENDIDWQVARVKLMRTALVNDDRELLEQTFQSVVDIMGEDSALDLLIDLTIEQDKKEAITG